MEMVASSSSSSSSSSEESSEVDYETREALDRLCNRMDAGGVSEDDQEILRDFLQTMEKRLVMELVQVLGEANEVLSMETLTTLPERAQEILGEALGISQTSICRMAKLSNKTRTLRIVIKSFLKTRR